MWLDFPPFFLLLFFFLFWSPSHQRVLQFWALPDALAESLCLVRLADELLPLRCELWSAEKPEPGFGGCFYSITLLFHYDILLSGPEYDMTLNLNHDKATLSSVAGSGQVWNLNLSKSIYQTLWCQSLSQTCKNVEMHVQIMTWKIIYFYSSIAQSKMGKLIILLACLRPGFHSQYQNKSSNLVVN